MLDLTNLKITIEQPLLEYICSKYEYTDYVTFIEHDDSVVDIYIDRALEGDIINYENLSDFTKGSESDISIDDFKAVNDVHLSKYFKLYVAQ